jgi:hypothetical protein
MTQTGLTVDVTVVELAQQMGWFPLRGYFSSDTDPVCREAATLIQRNSDHRCGTLDDKHTGCTKSFFKFFVRDGR